MLVETKKHGYQVMETDNKQEISVESKNKPVDKSSIVHAADMSKPKWYNERINLSHDGMIW